MNRRQLGFTLIEVLLGLTLTAIVMTVALSALRFSNKAWEAGESRSDGFNDIQITHRVVSRLLSEAQPVVVEASGKQRLMFAGDADRVRFVTRMPPYPDEPGLYLLEIRVESSDEENFALRLKRQRFSSESGEQQASDDDADVLLWQGKAKPTFSYHGVSFEDEWNATWQVADEWPGAIRLQFESVERAVSPMPTMIAAMRIQASAACAVPGLPGFCLAASNGLLGVDNVE